jgi:SpoIID/LytB domain protein
MNINAAFPSTYLKAADLQGKRVVVGIDRVSIEEVGGEHKPVVYFIGKDRGLILNKTNGNIIAEMYGPETDDWHAQKITLYPARVEFQGKIVDAIRVHLDPMANAAMQAQAIAGRSYAALKTATRSGCNCQIYASTLDQAFVGYSKEIATSGNLWVAAVNATIVDANTALVVTHNDSIIATYYSSSTGGKTQPTSEVWGRALTYSVSVDDPWSKDPRVNNPTASWTDSIDQATLVTKLREQGVNVSDVLSMTVAENYPSGAIKVLNLTDSAGNVTTLTIAPGQPVTPDELRGVLGTKSTFISAIAPAANTVAASPATQAAPAKKLTTVAKVNWPTKTIQPSDFNFTGRVSPAQAGATVKLQRKSGGKWKTVSSTTSNGKGNWAILWTGPPAGSHDLRITATNAKGTIKTTTKRVTMVGSIGLSAPKSAKRNSTFTVSGIVKPGYEGVTVVLQSKVGNGSWKTVDRIKTDSAGKWSSARSTGSKKFTVSYRVKTTDPRLGKLTSKVIKTNVK